MSNKGLIQQINDELNSIEDLRKKYEELKKDRIEREYEELIHRKKEIETIKSIDLSKVNIDRIKRLKEENAHYLQGAKKSGVFINNDFKGKVPYFGRNLILITANTGEGKSTTSANLAFHALKQGQKVLVITNEENVTDVYNRVTCLIKGWPYTNHDEFTDDQIDTFNKYIDILSERMVVVDDSFNGSSGATTTLEGIQAILESLIKNKSKFSVVILDYYQNVYRSSKNPRLEDWKVQEQLSNYLDSFKNRYDAPLVILAQKKPTKKDQDEVSSYKDLIEGRKIIANKATCIIEMVAERELLRTKWIIRKSRFPASVGETIYTAYDKGKYIPYTKEFANKILVEKERSQLKNVLSKINKEEESNGET